MQQTHLMHSKVWMTSNSKLAYVGLVSIADAGSCPEDSAVAALSMAGENLWSLLEDTLWPEGEALSPLGEVLASVGEVLPLGEDLLEEGEALLSGEALSVGHALWSEGEALSPLGEVLVSVGEALPLGEALLQEGEALLLGEALSLHEALWSVDTSSVEVLKFTQW